MFFRSLLHHKKFRGLTLKSPSYFDVSVAQGGGAHSAPPRELPQLLAVCHEIWHRGRTSRNLQVGTIRISQGHQMGAQFNKIH